MQLKMGLVQGKGFGVPLPSPPNKNVLSTPPPHPRINFAGCFREVSFVLQTLDGNESHNVNNN